MMPEVITGLTQALLDCVTNKLISDGRPVCDACVMTGSETPPADGCDCTCENGQGRAWVRMSAINPAFGTDVSKCPSGAWNLSLELGIWRCAKDTKGRCEDALADATAMHADLTSLMIAVSCCTALNDKAWSPVQARPLGPLGGCIAAVYEITVQLNHLTRA